MKESAKHTGRHSMKWKVIGILMVCWLIPFAVMFGVLCVYVATSHSDMTAQNFKKQLEFNNEICVERLNALVVASRQASYDRQLLAVNTMERAGSIGNVSASRSYKIYLADHYQDNDAVSSTLLWFQEDPEEVYSVYNQSVNGSYNQIRTYRKNDHEAVMEFAAGLDTRTGFLYRNGRLYLVRNLVDSSFMKRGVLVFILNQKYCFSSLVEYPYGDGVHIQINDEKILLSENPSLEKRMEKDGAGMEGGYDWSGGRLCVWDSRRGDNYSLTSTILLRKDITQYPFYGYPYVMGGLLFSLIPMVIIVLRVFRRQVSDPVKLLSDGAKHMENGELGYQIPEINANTEFAYLRNSFNDMSSHLKRQFDHIYQEEIALREARIMALQSHINPHFMNNTLEIINWEARLEGNVKVSRMIEALSNMMDAALDRRKRPEVRLAEEMGYVNSYLYITKERLGKRLTVETDIPEELMDYLVPRLILQPVVENAIEHGVVPNGSGTVIIRGCQDEKYLYLEIINNGGLSKEDKQKIDRLLSPGYNTAQEPGGNMGIANVNQRLRIFFGEPCGLSITEYTEGRVISKLTIPLRKFDVFDKTIQ